MLLPDEATPVDVAYELSTETGDRCLAAKINGRLAPLSSPLRDGDVVEIFTETDGALPIDGPDARRGPAPRSGSTSSSRRTPSGRSAAGSTSTTSPASASPTRCGWAGRAIGLALRKHDRGLASDVPLRQLAEELGYPDLETLLVAVVERTVSPDAVVEQLIAHGRPETVIWHSLRSRGFRAWEDAL